MQIKIMTRCFQIVSLLLNKRVSNKLDVCSVSFLRHVWANPDDIMKRMLFQKWQRCSWTTSCCHWMRRSLLLAADVQNVTCGKVPLHEMRQVGLYGLFLKQNSCLVKLPMWPMLPTSLIFLVLSLCLYLLHLPVGWACSAYICMQLCSSCLCLGRHCCHCGGNRVCCPGWGFIPFSGYSCSPRPNSCRLGIIIILVSLSLHLLFHCFNHSCCFLAA